MVGPCLRATSSRKPRVSSMTRDRWRSVMGMIMRMSMSIPMPVVMALLDGHGRGQHESPGLDPFRADQAVGQLPEELGRPPEQDDFQASPGVEVDVGRGHHPV